MAFILQLAFAALASLIFAALRLYRWRKEVKSFGLPSPAGGNYFLGDLVTIGKHFARLGQDANFNYVVDAMGADLGNPKMYILDMVPSLTRSMIIIRDPAIAETLTKASPTFPYSVTKSPTMQDIHPVVGRSSIISTEGEAWKALRKRFNPGFQPQYLQSLLPLMMPHIKIFDQKLQKLAESGEVASMSNLLTALTYDIITQVTIDEDMHAQDPEKTTLLIKSFQKTLITFKGYEIWDFWPRVRARRWYWSRILDREVEKLIRKKFNERGDKKDRSVISLSFAGIDELTPEVMVQTRDQLKTFLFAGHDTTASTLQWCYFYIWKHPEFGKAVRAELQDIFGAASFEEIAAVIVNEPDRVIPRLVLLSALIKEALRLHPAASTVRVAPKGSNYTITSDGKTYPVDNVVLFVNHFTLHRNAEVWGSTANEFDPYRFIEGSPSYREIPAGGFRPFERGPRNCIGQELSLLEAKVILATTISKYDFTKIGLDGITEREVYDSAMITSRPVDGMAMKISLRK